MLHDKSIIIITPYFGKWPEWMPFYVESCRWNPSINWLFYTDCEIPLNIPSNMKFVATSYKDYKKMVSEKLGIHFDPTSPYKLCDIKPTFGFLHSEEIQGYDYFAFGDLDLIYGDLRKHLGRLNDYDLISTHDTRVSGHLCLHKNTKRMREAFKQSKDWQRLMSMETHVAFDEKAYSKIFIRRKNWPKAINKMVSQCFPYQKNSLFEEAFSTPNCRIPWIDGSFNFPTEWYWNQGSLSANNTDREFMYFHFLYWKDNAWPSEYIDKDLLLQFDITSSKAPKKWKITASGIFQI